MQIMQYGISIFHIILTLKSYLLFIPVFCLTTLLRKPFPVKTIYYLEEKDEVTVVEKVTTIYQRLPLCLCLLSHLFFPTMGDRATDPYRVKNLHIT